MSITITLKQNDSEEISFPFIWAHAGGMVYVRIESNEDIVLATFMPPPLHGTGVSDKQAWYHRFNPENQIILSNSK